MADEQPTDTQEQQEFPDDVPVLPSDREGLGETAAAEEVFGLLGSDPGFQEEEDGEIDGAGAREEDDLPLGSEQAEDEGGEVEEDFEPVEEAEGVEPEEQTGEEDGEDDSEPSDSDLPQTVTVKVDGEEKEVPLEEAVAGYQRQEAFTRKTQELAEQRRELRQQAQHVRAVQEEYADRLQMVEEAIEAMQPERPDQELAQSNPAEYARRMQAYETRQEQLEKIRQERENTQAQAQEISQEERQARLVEEQEKLVAAIPELLDPDKGVEIKRKMAETAQEEYGFAPKELGQVVDHRAMRLLYDAMRYRELEERGKEVTTSKKGKSKKTLKPGSSGRSKKSKSASRDVSDARERLAQSGSVRDATKVLERFIEE